MPFSAAIADHLDRSRAVMERAAGDARLHAAIGDAAALMLDALRGGRKVLLAGNGGSAADAQHIAAELVGRFRKDRPALPAIALTTDTSILTAVGNDYGFEQIFARQVSALGQPGDVLIALSTSGNSPNVLAACAAAAAIGVRIVGLTGEAGGQLAPLCTVWLPAPSADTALIQQVHIAIGHALCGIVEDAFAGAP